MRLSQEIIVDNFAGGGGASTGIEMATGRSVDIAINHDPAAIAMHRANHPETEHYCESVWDVDPREVTGGRPVGLAWFSPDCTHHSKARGGKPREKGIRGLAWVAVRWAATVKPRVIIIENVEEFVSWGPLDKDGYPIKEQAGRTFKTFINAMRRLGYKAEWRELRACDYGAPTIRKRLFIVFRRDGRPIVWPDPTHGDPASEAVRSGRLKPWRTAAEIIDWSIPCPSIFDSAKEIKEKFGIKVIRPLAENTKRRIARGIQRFVIDNQRPFVIKVNHSGEQFRGQETDEPLQTVTAKNGWGVVTPYIARIGQTGYGGDRLQYPLDKPLTTVTTKAEHLLVSPTLIEIGYGEGPGQNPRAPGLQKPLGTVVAGGRKHALVAAFIAKHYGGVTGVKADTPFPTITTRGTQNQLVTAHIARHFGESVGNPMDDPIGTVMAGGGGKSALVTSHLIKLRGTCADGQPVTEPMPTITAGGLHVGEVRAFLIKYYGAGTGQDLTEPMHTIPTHDRFGLVTIEGVDYQIVDIGMRMLESHELYAAQGFPSNYIIDGYLVNGRPVSKEAKVARCGNSVPPPFARALVRANLPEHCTGSGNALRLERYSEASGQLQLSM